MLRQVKWISLPLIFLIISFFLAGCKLRTFKEDVQLAPVVPVVPVKVSTAKLTEKEKSIIVFTDEFKQAAHYFSYLHREYEGIDSVLLNIATMNGTAESRRSVSQNIQNKIAELNKGDDIMAVLILGNKSIIPVSKFKTGKSSTIYSSDYGYGGIADSPENVVPVGRIPAGNNAEAMVVAQKYERWYQDRDFRPAWPVSFIGGEGFSKNDLSDPELLFFSLQEEGMAGPEAIRYLGGAGGCLPARLRQSFADDDVSVQWLALNSVADGFRVGNGTLLTSDILNLDYKPGLPIVLNPSREVASDNSTMTPAEALILSRGAGLAVMTGCGDAGKVTAELDDGCISRVSLDGTSRLLVEFHKAYFSGKYRIAEALAEARAQFVQNSRRGDDLGPIYDMIFYGDPVMSLPLPVRTESPAYTGLKPITKPVFPKGVAVFYANSTISFAMEEGGIYPGVQVQVVDRKTGKTVSSMKVLEDDIFNFTSDSAGSYLIYSRPLDGPIAWQFFDIYKNKNSQANLANSARHTIPVKTSPVVKAGIEPVLYSVQVSSNRRESSALKVRKRLTKKGYSPAYVVTVPSSHNRPWYCVRFGEFNSWADAVEASAKYEKKEQADVKIVRCHKGS